MYSDAVNVFLLSFFATSCKSESKTDVGIPEISLQPPCPEIALSAIGMEIIVVCLLDRIQLASCNRDDAVGVAQIDPIDRDAGNVEGVDNKTPVGEQKFRILREPIRQLPDRAVGFDDLAARQMHIDLVSGGFHKENRGDRDTAPDVQGRPQQQRAFRICAQVPGNLIEKGEKAAFGEILEHAHHRLGIDSFHPSGRCEAEYHNGDIRVEAADPVDIFHPRALAVIHVEEYDIVALHGDTVEHFAGGCKRPDLTGDALPGEPA